MAEIFLARSRGMAGFGRYVVLKRILPERGTDARWIEMFLDEARLAAQLQHPNVAQVFDLGRLGEGYFFTMEYVHGANMREVLVRCAQRGHKLSLSMALGVAVGAAAGLDHAHERRDSDGKSLGIVHRDVSPSNLMVSYDGVVKLVDFGVAKAHLRSSVTQSGTVKGKISYLSPEQCRGREVDRRSDIFALGIVLYEMATTKRLYRRNSDFETMTAIVSEMPEAPSRYNPEVSPKLDQAILRALAKDPAHRQQSASELLEELEDVAKESGFSISTSHLRRQMRELYGEPVEPWRALEQPQPARREAEVTYTADGLLEDLDSVEVPVPEALADPRITAQLRRPSEAPSDLSPTLSPTLAPGARLDRDLGNLGGGGPSAPAFPLEVDAAQVPLLDSLRAAIAVTSDLEHNQSTIRPEPALAPTEIAPPIGAFPITQKQPALSGPNSRTITASPVGAADKSGSGPTETLSDSGHHFARAASEPGDPSRLPRAASEPGVPRMPTAAEGSSRASSQPGPRSLSEAITIPLVASEALQSSGRAPTPLPTLLAGGQVSTGNAPSQPPGASIWDRPMQGPSANPAPASSAPSTTARPAQGTPGYQPRSTLLGSAPPPSRQRSASTPPPSGDKDAHGSGHRLPGMPPPRDPQQAMHPQASHGQMRAQGSQGPMHAPSAQPPHLRGQGSQPPPSYGGGMPMPAYPRAPIDAAPSGAGRVPQEADEPRRVFSPTAFLIALVCIGIALGAYLAVGGDDAAPRPQPTEPANPVESAPPSAPEIKLPAAENSGGTGDSAAPSPPADSPPPAPPAEDTPTPAVEEPEAKPAPAADKPEAKPRPAPATKAAGDAVKPKPIVEKPRPVRPRPKPSNLPIVEDVAPARSSCSGPLCRR
jgi:serine/threonine protein kinase